MGKKLTGLDKVIKSLNKELSSLVERTDAGLMAAGLIIQRDAQKRVPIEYGNLRASAYTQPHPERAHVVQIGFGSSYAAAVHENMEQKWKGKPRKSGLGTYWGPEGEPKYMEKAIASTREDVIRTVAAYSRVKKNGNSDE